VVTGCRVIAMAMILSTVVTSEVLVDNRRDRANKVLEKPAEKYGPHGDKAREIKNELNGGRPGSNDPGHGPVGE
jgi:hypothetical protein